MLQETKTKETKVKCKATISEKAGKINTEEPTPRQNLFYFCLFVLSFKFKDRRLLRGFGEKNHVAFKQYTPEET